LPDFAFVSSTLRPTAAPIGLFVALAYPPGVDIASALRRCLTPVPTVGGQFLLAVASEEVPDTIEGDPE
jgi:hypothetical protein